MVSTQPIVWIELEEHEIKQQIKDLMAEFNKTKPASTFSNLSKREFAAKEYLKEQGYPITEDCSIQFTDMVSNKAHLRLKSPVGSTLICLNV